VYFCTLCPSIGPKERSRQPLDRLPLVCNFVTNFWMQHFDGARLSPNSVRNAVWHALNEPVYQHLRTRNPRCSTVYIDNSLGPLARDSPCICASNSQIETVKYFSKENYGMLILLNNKNSTCWFFSLFNFCRESMDYKQRVYKKQNFFFAEFSIILTFIANNMGSHTVHTYILPRICSALA